MKLAIVSITLAILSSVAFVGCGKNDSNQPAPNAVAAAVPAPVVNQQVCQPGYVFNGSTCVYGNNTLPGAPGSCPIGTTWANNTCIPITGGGVSNCPAGTYFNGTTCQVSGATGCPYGTTWNAYYYQCTPTNCPWGTTWYNGVCSGMLNSPMQSYPQGYNCKYTNNGGYYKYSCYYTGGYTGIWFNGGYWTTF